MKVKSIRTTNSTNGKNLVIWYDDDDGTLQMAVVDIDNGVSDAINEFMSTGDAVALLEYVLQMTHTLDDYREDVKNGLNKRLEALSEHLSTDGDHVYYDNDTFENVMLDESLEDHIVRILKGGDDDDLHAVCRFAERVYSNVDPQIRSQMFSWLKSQGMLTFDDDGRIIGYRGGEIGDDGVAQSIHCGPAIVNGEHVNGHVPNPDGAIVEMPRGSVQHDPSVDCSSGLHVGTYEYARWWARGVIMRVAVAPEDVVSVPFDCDAQKLRCCRFEVLSHELCTPSSDYGTSDWQNSLTYHVNDDDDDDNDDSADDECHIAYRPVFDTNIGDDDDNDAQPQPAQPVQSNHAYRASEFSIGSTCHIDYSSLHSHILAPNGIDGMVMQVMPDSVVIKTQNPTHFLRIYYDTMHNVTFH